MTVPGRPRPGVALCLPDPPVLFAVPCLPGGPPDLLDLFLLFLEMAASIQMWIARERTGDNDVPHSIAPAPQGQSVCPPGLSVGVRKVLLRPWNLLGWGVIIKQTVFGEPRSV